MVTGKKKQEQNFITVDEIMSRTSGGYDIYMYYIGKVARLMQRPWGRREKKLSWGIFPYNGIWLWKDQASEDAGSAVQFVEKMFGLSFADACAKIIQDFQLQPQITKKIIVKPAIVTWDEPTEDEKNYVRMSYTSKPWGDPEHLFYDGTGVTQPHAEKYEVWAVKDYAIAGRKGSRLHSKEVIWAYYCPEEDAVKLYFPERGFDEFNPKFRNNVSGSHLWNYENLLKQCDGQPCEKGIIQKSTKDALVTLLYTDNVIWSQNEQSKLFLNQHTIDKVNKLFQNVWLSFGSDDDGKQKSIKVTKANGWNWVNPPNNLLPDINDFYSLAKGKSPKAVEDLLKYKKFL